MKKLILIFLVGLLASFGVSAQSGFFGPLPKPTHKYVPGKYNLSVDSVIKSIRPVVVLAADVSDGAQLAGGAGIGYQVNKWDAASGNYITKWSVSLVGLLGTTGTKITGTGGVVIGIPGTNGIIGVGGGRDFTQSAWVLITGAVIKFN